MKYYLKFLRTFTAKGRASRKEFWLVGLFNLIACAILTILLITIANEELWSLLKRIYANYGLLGAIQLLPNVLSTTVVDGIVGRRIATMLTLYSLGTFIQSITLQIRRLHDIDKNGWSILLGMIPMVGGIIIFVFNVTKGTVGSNRYGAVQLQSTWRGGGIHA